MDEMDDVMAKQKAIVMAELEEALKRCEAAGVPHLLARGYLMEHFAAPLLDVLLPEAQYPQLLEDIFKLDQQGERALAKEKKLAWLMLAHGVQLGDTVLVTDREAPQEICLEDFDILWRPQPGRMHIAAQDGVLVLNGLTVHTQGVRKTDNMAPVHARLTRQDAPSPRLQLAMSRRNGVPA